jgi:DNA repair photolyase
MRDSSARNPAGAAGKGPGGFHRREADNPRNRFESLALEYDEGVERPQDMRVFREHAKSILNANDSPDIPFRYSVNPYRGCAHACSYCYARRTHEYLGWSAGTDFDTQIVAKMNAPELLEKELSKPSWRGESIVFSGVTDCYQPAESRLRLTRRCLEVCLRHDTPVGMITKSALITRDVDVLAELARGPGATAAISIPFWNAGDARRMEPFAAPPEARFRALEKLSAAGVRTGISLAPIVPGLNDADIPKLLKRAAECGATFAFYTLLRLPGSVKDVFLSRMARDFPERAGKIEHHMRETHAGSMALSDWGRRMTGSGQMAAMIAAMFRLHARKNGLDGSERAAAREAARSKVPRGMEETVSCPRARSFVPAPRPVRPPKPALKSPESGQTSLFDSL